MQPGSPRVILLPARRMRSRAMSAIDLEARAWPPADSGSQSSASWTTMNRRCPPSAALSSHHGVRSRARASEEVEDDVVVRIADGD